MTKARWWLLAAAAILVIPAASAGVAISVVDPNDFKPALADAVRDATGRAFTLDGPLRITWSLWPSISVTNVKLANLAGGSRPDMATAERIDARISLPALLWHRLDVAKLTLIGPDILFEQVGTEPNWEFDRTGGPQPPTNASYTLHISSVHVQNGIVIFHLPARTRVVGVRALDFHQPTGGGPLDFASVLVYSDYRPFTLNASAQPTAGLTDPWNTHLHFAAFGTVASADGRMNLAGDFDLNIHATAPELEKLNVVYPPLQLPALDQVTVTTHLTNGPVRGGMPTVGKTELHFGGADLSDLTPGLKLGDTRVSLPAAGAPATLSSVADYAGQTVKLAGTVTVPKNPGVRASVAVDLNMRTPAAATARGTLAVKGTLAVNGGAFDGLDAGIVLHAPALATLRPFVSRPLPALTDVSLAGRLSVPADSASLTLDSAKLVASQGDLAGHATIGMGSPVTLSADLTSTRLDVDAAERAFGVTAPAPTAAPGQGDGKGDGKLIPDTALPWAALRGPDVTLAARIAAATYRAQVWRDVDLSLRLHDGALQVSRFHLAFPGEAMDASLTVNAAASPVPVAFTLHAPAIPLAVITHDMALPGPVDGSLKVDARLDASGQTYRALAASLGGSLSATMTSGSLSNAALVKLAAPALKSLKIPVPAQGRAAINCFGLIGSFSKGIGRFTTIAADTTYLKVDGLGQVDLGTETLALKLSPTARIAGSPVEVPVVVDGRFGAVQSRLDASGFDKIGLLIDGWFGGDKPDTCSDAGLVPAPPSRH